jgi:hypothetical protein
LAGYALLSDDWKTNLAVACLAPKKWEDEGYFDHLLAKAEGLKRSAGASFLGYKDFDFTYENSLKEIFRIRRVSKSRRERNEKLDKFISHLTHDCDENPLLDDLRKSGRLTQYYDSVRLVQRIFLDTSEKQFKFSRLMIPQDYELQIPPLESYDQHTRQGFSVMKRYFDKIKLGKRLPAGLKLNLSGGILATAFRSLAYQKYGRDYLCAGWEDVSVTAEEEKLLWELERHHNPALFN